MPHDRILLDPGEDAGDHRSSAPHVRQARLGDTVLYKPEHPLDPAELAEVELEGQAYVLLCQPPRRDTSPVDRGFVSRV